MVDSPSLRKFSSCAVSDITVSSLSGTVASTHNNFGHHSISAENIAQTSNGPTQSNVKIESCSGIRVGDVIYNIYSPSPPTESRVLV